MPLTGRGEVEYRKFFVEFSGGGVVGFCGVDFIVEIANGFAFTIIGYPNNPFLCSFLPAHSFIF